MTAPPFGLREVAAVLVAAAILAVLNSDRHVLAIAVAAVVLLAAVDA